MPNHHIARCIVSATAALIIMAAPPAAQSAPPAAKPTPQEQAARRTRFMERTGGFVTAAPSGPALILLNTQRKVPGEVLHQPVEQIGRGLRLRVEEMELITAQPLEESLKQLRNPGTAAIITLCDSGGYPALLLAPESRWALVNVAALGDQDTPPELLRERARKEIWRAFGYLMGAAHSTFEPCLLKSILKPSDLDKIDCQTICPEPFAQIGAHAGKLGMVQRRTATYRKAVEEGWAPSPTNDFQKAIWQELKQPEPANQP